MKLIRLTTGEEIIATVTECDDEIKVEDGILLVPAGEGKIGMIPFMPYGDGSPIVINTRHVMFMTTPTEDLQRQVLKLTTGIETPSSTIIT